MPQVYKLKELQIQLRDKLTPDAGGPEEATVMASWLLEHFLFVSRTELLLNASVNISSETLQRINEAVVRLRKQEPIQYVLGEADFYGRTFMVSPNVLIPRRETEELVALVKQENQQTELSVLDVGTGSGCVAVTLAKELNAPRVHAFDISEAAVRIAQGNAVHHQADVAFVVGDLFDEQLSVPSPFDVVVSNPPYVRRSEAAAMADRVVRYEPGQALFVSDADPLRYYREIAHRCCQGWLQSGGRVYLEINESLGAEVMQVLKNEHFTRVILHKDLQRKERFVSAILL
ncbi:MAG: peptide chain release factor N(5)-glutamine methyltransferase [Tunicatimonas sp.]